MLDRFARAGHSPRADRIAPLRTLTAEVVGDHATRALGDLRDPAAVDALRALAVCGDLLDFPWSARSPDRTPSPSPVCAQP
ncbi:hypothetical protein OIM90_31110 [Streptomyces sp. AD16]|nr:hypothetical protein OIM90_31110 [Streptomyces sp. AD16]